VTWEYRSLTTRLWGGVQGEPPREPVLGKAGKAKPLLSLCPSAAGGDMLCELELQLHACVPPRDRCCWVPVPCPAPVPEALGGPCLLSLQPKESQGSKLPRWAPPLQEPPARSCCDAEGGSVTSTCSGLSAVSTTRRCVSPRKASAEMLVICSLLALHGEASVRMVAPGHRHPALSPPHPYPHLFPPPSPHLRKRARRWGVLRKASGPT
jgi:hypothetical protein